MLFYSMLNSENKIYDLKNSLMLCRFSNDLFALKKRRILTNLTRNKEKMCIKLLMNMVLISLILSAFLKSEIQNGASDVNFEICPKILVEFLAKKI